MFIPSCIKSEKLHVIDNGFGSFTVDGAYEGPMEYFPNKFVPLEIHNELLEESLKIYKDIWEDIANREYTEEYKYFLNEAVTYQEQHQNLTEEEIKAWSQQIANDVCELTD